MAIRKWHWNLRVLRLSLSEFLLPVPAPRPHSLLFFCGNALPWRAVLGWQLCLLSVSTQKWPSQRCVPDPEFKWATPPILLHLSLSFFFFLFKIFNLNRHLKWSCLCIYSLSGSPPVKWESSLRAETVQSCCLLSTWGPRIEDTQSALVCETDGLCREKIPTGFLRWWQHWVKKCELCPKTPLLGRDRDPCGSWPGLELRGPWCFLALG